MLDECACLLFNDDIRMYVQIEGKENCMQIIHGDCLEVLRSLPEHSVDAIVSDPPAGISFMNMAFDSDRGGRDNWIAWLADIMSEARRVVKPGGHAFIWALPRTSHWTALALENAGWEIREKTYHIFASGFPKSHNISKAIDRHFQAEREVVGTYDSRSLHDGYDRVEHKKFSNVYHGDITAVSPITAPATPEATQWDGWGTATKPAVEEWILARAPLAEKSIAENVLKYGVGGLNIDGTRVGSEQTKTTIKDLSQAHGNQWGKAGIEYPAQGYKINPPGRWPSNLLLSHSLFCIEDQCVDDCPVAVLDRQSGIRKSGGRITQPYETPTLGVTSFSRSKDFQMERSEGGASRYFQTFYYCPKPSKRERNAGCDELPPKFTATMNDGIGKREHNPEQPGAYNGNHHPTVKPAQLMQYLCKLITPPGGTVLDPFMGSGTTGVACIQEGFDFIGVEREPEYIEIARARIEHAQKLHAEK